MGYTYQYLLCKQFILIKYQNHYVWIHLKMIVNPCHSKINKIFIANNYVFQHEK